MVTAAERARVLSADSARRRRILKGIKTASKTIKVPAKEEFKKKKNSKKKLKFVLKKRRVSKRRVSRRKKVVFSPTKSIRRGIAGSTMVSRRVVKERRTTKSILSDKGLGGFVR